MARARQGPVERDGAGAVVARVAAAFLGNYVLTVGAATLLAVLLARVGMARSEAALLAMMLAFPGFLVVLLWVFHTRRLARAWSWIAGAGAICYLVAQALAGKL